MANTSINDLVFLNQKIVEIDNIRMSLSQATALMQVTSNDNFLKNSNTTVDLYLSIVFELVDESRQLSHLVLQSLKGVKK